jgi:polyisoprenoid-binding protein YceI
MKFHEVLPSMALGAVLFFPFAGVAAAEAPLPESFTGACEVTFLVTSTLHDFPGSGRCDPFTATVVRDAAGRRVLPVVAVEVPAAGLDTRNKSRDGQMREMFQADRYPRIHGEARDVDVERIREETGMRPGGKAPVDLSLRIRDVERKVRATAGNLKESGDRVTFDLEFAVSLKEFDLKAPTVLRIIRVGDKVSVKAAFTLTVSRAP